MMAKASVDGAVIRWLASMGLDKIRGRTLEKKEKGRNFCNIEQLWLIENYLWGKNKAGGCSGATFLPLLLTCAVQCAEMCLVRFLNPFALPEASGLENLTRMCPALTWLHFMDSWHQGPP